MTETKHDDSSDFWQNPYSKHSFEELLAAGDIGAVITDSAALAEIVNHCGFNIPAGATVHSATLKLVDRTLTATPEYYSPNGLELYGEQWTSDDVDAPDFGATI